MNPVQREAVTSTEGPLLVLAGAGSGKTRVITYRVAYLLEQAQARPEEILAVTFTNNAADEMRTRVEGLVGTPPRWVSTFHSFCARLLRREAEAAGLKRDFVIYDDEDQERLVRGLLKELGLDQTAWTPRSVLERISRAKTAGAGPAEWAASENPRERELAPVFARYGQGLAAAGALDFDDLLLRAVALLAGQSEVRRRYGQRFRYVQVDEYQDTNRPQYELLRLLTGEHQNLCVVGDEDQSIYGWRGADYGNIFRFEQDFPGTRVILLEQNYRSSQPILDAATALIGHNRQRKGKVLWSERREGPKPKLYEAERATEESQFVAETIWQYRRTQPGERLAVLYRTNAQSRLFEEALRRYAIPYRVVGGFSFYKRAEVKDLLAYVRLARNPADNQSLLRILNVPARGLGATTSEALFQYAQSHAVPLWEAVEALAAEPTMRTAKALAGFRAFIEQVHGELAQSPLSAVLRFVLRESGWEEKLRQAGTEEALGRLENLQELIQAAEESEGRGEASEEFLDRAALVSDADDYDPSSPVTLMTLHSAKGTEFSVVFLTGLEEGVFPHTRSLGTEAEIEEERRLCYVGMTRAQNELYLTRARRRRGWGSAAELGDYAEESTPSRFLEEVPTEMVERIGVSTEGVALERGWRYEPVAEPRWPRRARGRGRGRRRYAEEEDVPVRVVADPDAPFPLGTVVRHSRFGVGTVVGIDGVGADRKLTVSFPGYGRKKLVEKYAGLERV
ncbi:MAG: UvrD-helicase domain-containing protein [Acidobacteria bacterium]|nr:UvrD-helicase domain-containing protein [Acidobacteriota bacterium]